MMKISNYDDLGHSAVRYESIHLYKILLAMKITQDTKLKNFKEQFSGRYKGLRIEFYQNAHQPYEGTHVQNTLDDEAVMSDLVSVQLPYSLTFDDDMSVNDFEQLLETELGLHAQVFRRSNAIWLQTTKTDDWSLGKQNTKGLHSIQTN